MEILLKLAKQATETALTDLRRMRETEGAIWRKTSQPHDRDRNRARRSRVPTATRSDARS